MIFIIILKKFRLLSLTGIKGAIFFKLIKMIFSENSKKNKILATTGLQETWGNQMERIIFLGAWCHSYQNKDSLELNLSKIIKYHWLNREKLRIDYIYLEKLFERALIELVSSLNKYHNTDYSIRYWRIVLGPWLLSYVSVLWDRWESIRVAFDQENFDSTNSYLLDAEKLIPINFTNWDELIIDDLWNHHIFNEIINFGFRDKVKVNRLPYSGAYYLNKIQNKKNNYRHKILNLIDWLFEKLQKNYKIIFVSSYFSLSNLVKLCIRLKQLPRIHSIFSKYIDLENIEINRDCRFNLRATNLFEEFFKKNIINHMPIAYLEGYDSYNTKISEIKCNSQAIFTANAHLHNDIFNLWCAKKVEGGSKLFLSQHGGGIKSEMTIFRHQEKIADKMIVWHKPLEQIHIQLTANKLINLSKKNIYRKYLTIVGYEPKTYTNRAQSGPKGEGVNDDFLQKLEFCNSLSMQIYDSIKVRSRSNGPGFFNSEFRYRDALGVDKISSHSSLYKAFKHSKIIVCTYPQTTFSEAMNSGAPTILIYSEGFWEFHESFLELIEQLKESQIIFTCPKKAAVHINNIWENPELWWNKSETFKVRQNYIQMCCKTNDNWINEWASFFKQPLEEV